MTGLDLTHDALIEVAALVTDGELNVLGDGVDLVIKPTAAALDQMGDFVRSMHEGSGLLSRAGRRSDHGRGRATGPGLRPTVRAGPRKAPLAGNTIGTDRAFLARDMPTFEHHVHYRSVDVSSIKELVRRWYPRVYYQSPAKSGNHRALADVEESIEELRYYREAVFVPPPGPDSNARRRSRSPPGRPDRGRPRTRTDYARQPRPVHFTLRRCRPETCSDRAHGGCSSVGRAPGCGPGRRGFESRHSPKG